MVPFLRTPILISALLALPAIALAQDAVRPGYWDYTTSTLLPGSSDGKRCVRPEQIDEFMSGPHNKHYHCTYPVRHVADGRALFDGVCVGKHGDQYKVKVSGDYSPTRFTLKGHIQGAILGVPMTSPIAIDAQWIGPDCPAGAK